MEESVKLPFSFFLAKQKADALFFLRFLLLFDRDDRFQCLNHGSAVMLLHPRRKRHQLRFDCHAVFCHSKYWLHLLWVVSRFLGKTGHIAVDFLVASSKRDDDFRPNPKCAFQLWGDDVLKYFIQFFMRNVYDYICVHIFPQKTNPAVLPTPLGSSCGRPCRISHL